MVTNTEILNYMRTGAYRPVGIEELATVLNVDNLKKFHRQLDDLEAEGLIVRTRKDRYGVPDKMNLAVGWVQVHARGFGFLIQDDPELKDVFISSDNIASAMHGDRVIVRLNRDNVGRPEGEVIKILTRANKQVVGTFEKRQKHGFTVPDDVRLRWDILIPDGQSKGAKNGDKVVVEITRWPEPRRNPEGKIIEKIGRQGDPGVDILTIIKKHQLPEEFPKNVLHEADKISLTISPDELAGRQDLRQQLIVTIDGEDAKDLDDAVTLTRTPEGNYHLGVHIADVGYYVREGSELDKEAYHRGTSVYLVDRVLPMLPQRLSNGICSLNAGEDRLALGVEIEVSKDGEVLSHRILESVILVKERLTYSNVNRLLEGDAEQRERYRELAPMLELMAELSGILTKRREQRGSIDFNFPEVKVILDGEGHPVEIKKRERGVSERLIEEFMLLANEVIAEHYFTLKSPFLYRVHEEPSEDKITELSIKLDAFGYHLNPGSRGKIRPAALQHIVHQADGQPEERAVNTMVLRTMRLARYEAECRGHFGLAAQYYTHFTSPIRRYPDLVIHRIIREILRKGQLAEKRKAQLLKRMPEIAEQSSNRERVAEEAERETVDLKKVEYMQRFIGQTFPGIVSGVTNFGFFVEIDFGLEGLVHVSNLTDDYYHYDETKMALIGEHTGQVYKIGQEVQISVARANVELRQVDFELVKSNEKGLKM